MAVSETVMSQWLSKFVGESDVRAIEDAIARAELRTTGEIVPMIVRESAAYGHVEMIATLAWFAFFVLVLQLEVVPHLWAWNLAALVASVALGWIFARIGWFRRLTTSKRDQILAVGHRAQLEFHATGIPATKGHTGVLIFVSLQERRAVVLGDEAISSKLPASTWDQIVNELVKSFGAGRAREGFENAIAHVGEILSREFPAASHDSNELPNTLIIKD